MNYYKAAEQVLSSMPALKKSLKNLKQRQQRLLSSGAPKDVGAIDYSKSFTSAHHANDVLEELLAVSECTRNIAITESKIDEINGILDQLQPEYEKILVLWYVRKNTKEEIAEIMGYGSVTTVYNVRNRAVAEFALLYFGAGAIDSI